MPPAVKDTPAQSLGRGIVIAAVAGAFYAGFHLLWRGAKATPVEVHVFNLVFPVALTYLLFEAVIKRSTATLAGTVKGWTINMTGAAGFYAGMVIILYWVSPPAPPPPPKSVNFMVVQGGTLYKNQITVDWQENEESPKPVTFSGGRGTVGGIAAETEAIKVFDVLVNGKSYRPQGVEGPPPWSFPIEPGNNVRIDLGPLPTAKTCDPPTPDQLKALLAKWQKLGKGKADLDVVKEWHEKDNANAEARETVKQKAYLTVVNDTERYVNLIGIDCKKLWTPTDPLDTEDLDWKDFLEFLGNTPHEEKTFSEFRKWKKTTGRFCMFACVEVPDGKIAVYLGVYDFFDHERNRYRLVLSGNDQPVVMVPVTPGGSNE